jgi:aspartate carbamoyltransferase catalytic subunit
VHSLIKLLALYRGLKFTLISPPSLAMPAEIVEAVSRNGHVVETAATPAQALAGADIIYATRIQKERFANDEVLEGFDNAFEINRALIESACKPEVVVMHPLPRDGRPGSHDLSVDLNNDPRLAIFRQTDNGIPVRMALFASLLGVAGQVANSLRDTTWKVPRFIGPDDALFHGLDG